MVEFIKSEAIAKWVSDIAPLENVYWVAQCIGKNQWLAQNIIRGERGLQPGELAQRIKVAQKEVEQVCGHLRADKKIGVDEKKIFDDFVKLVKDKFTFDIFRATTSGLNQDEAHYNDFIWKILEAIEFMAYSLDADNDRKITVSSDLAGKNVEQEMEVPRFESFMAMLHWYNNYYKNLPDANKSQVLSALALLSKGAKKEVAIKVAASETSARVLNKLFDDMAKNKRFNEKEPYKNAFNIITFMTTIVPLLEKGDYLNVDFTNISQRMRMPPRLLSVTEGS